MGRTVRDVVVAVVVVGVPAVVGMVGVFVVAPGGVGVSGKTASELNPEYVKGTLVMVGLWGSLLLLLMGIKVHQMVKANDVFKKFRICCYGFAANTIPAAIALELMHGQFDEPNDAAVQEKIEFQPTFTYGVILCGAAVLLLAWVLSIRAARMRARLVPEFRTALITQMWAAAWWLLSFIVLVAPLVFYAFLPSTPTRGIEMGNFYRITTTMVLPFLATTALAVQIRAIQLFRTHKKGY